jgi:hypothetical protein
MKSPSEPIRDWRQNPAKHKHESSGKYSNDSLASPYCYAGIMMCRLWGLHDSANFTIEMVPLMEAAVNSIIMDWATILSDKLVVAVRDFRAKTVVTERKIPHFIIVLTLWIPCVLILSFLSSVGDGPPKTQHPFIYTIRNCGSPLTRTICIKFAMVLWFPFIILFLIGPFPKFPISLPLTYQL